MLLRTPMIAGLSLMLAIVLLGPASACALPCRHTCIEPTMKPQRTDHRTYNESRSETTSKAHPGCIQHQRQFETIASHGGQSGTMATASRGKTPAEISSGTRKRKSQSWRIGLP